MIPIPTASLRSARLAGFLTLLAVATGVVVLLLLPNLIMHASPGGTPSATVSAFGAPQSPGAVTPPILR